ncbi:MAG: ribose-phosphate diphosphokinase [Spirosomataceae bacterium]
MIQPTMKTLNLITPAISDIPFQSFTFPDGQPHLKLETNFSAREIARCRIVTRIANPADLLRVLLAKDVLEEAGAEQIDLIVSYLMAARMDRVMTTGEPFSLRVVTDILNQAGFHKIAVFDPHSEVTAALLRRSAVIPNYLFVKDCLTDFLTQKQETDYWLISPDAGALKKIHAVAQYTGAEQVAECMKMRDVRTGNLSGFKTLETDFKGQTCFIVDDICDGGGTFAGIGSLLKERNAGSVVLIVSHGIFSKGFAIHSIDFIYTTDSFRPLQEVPAHVMVKPITDYI